MGEKKNNAYPSNPPTPKHISWHNIWLFNLKINICFHLLVIKRLFSSFGSQHSQEEHELWYQNYTWFLKKVPPYFPIKQLTQIAHVEFHSMK